MRFYSLFIAIALASLLVTGCASNRSDAIGQAEFHDPHAELLTALITDLSHLRLESVNGQLDRLPDSARNDPRIPRIQQIVDVIEAYYRGDLRAAHRELADLNQSDRATITRHLFNNH